VSERCVERVMEKLQPQIEKLRKLEAEVCQLEKRLEAGEDVIVEYCDKLMRAVVEAMFLHAAAELLLLKECDPESWRELLQVLGRGER